MLASRLTVIFTGNLSQLQSKLYLLRNKTEQDHHYVSATGRTARLPFTLIGFPVHNDGLIITPG